MTEALLQEIRALKSVFESARDPEGRVFAPLADAYRRAGELQEAVRLINEGLARHPNFVPGHVVAARLYVEQGLTEEAAIAARNALDLDAENVSALRSLLRVLDQKAQPEADEVRSQLLSLEPDFVPEEVDEPPPPGTPGVSDTEATVEAPAVEAEAPSEGTPPGGGERTWSPPATAAPLEAIDLESMPLDIESLSRGLGGAYVLDEEDESPAEATPPTLVTGFGSPEEEPVIDLESLTPVTDEVEEVEEPVSLSELSREVDEPEVAAEEPVIDLESLAPVTEEAEEEEIVALSDLAPLPELPTEEPVIDLDDLAPPGAETGEAVELADLAPEAEEEPVMELADLAPEVEEEAVMELADLAPEAEEEPVMELADLAPEVEEEAVMELADLAPEAEEEAVVELSDLAPEAEEEAVMDLADLAPEAEEEAVMELADLAPEAEEEAVVELSDLAPEAEEEPVMELADLAPEDEEEAVMELADLAPEAEEEPVIEEPAESEDPADITMVDLVEMTAEEEVVIDLDALGPSATSEAEEAEASAEPEAEEAADEAPAAAEDDASLGEPVYTRTLAELYVKQGALDQALVVYRHLAELSPADTEITHRIAELESGLLPEDDGAEEETETLARELATHGDGEHDVESPFAWTDEKKEESEAGDSGPSIDDYFKGLLTWKPGEHS